jgi:Spy/CpxP family protein refolding chaperone
MTRKVLFIAVMVLSSGFVGFAARGWMHGSSVADLDALRDVGYLSKALDLTPLQRELIGALHTGLAARVSSCCDGHCAAKARILRGLQNDESGRKSAREAVEAMCRSQAESEMATFECLCAVRDVLTPAQRIRYDAMLGDALRCNCPASHGCRRPACDTTNGDTKACGSGGCGG